MKRRNLLGGLLGTALTGGLVLSNPTILENGLVVPDKHVIVPANEAKPIIYQASGTAARVLASQMSSLSLRVDGREVQLEEYGYRYQQRLEELGELPPEATFRFRMERDPVVMAELWKLMREGYDIRLHFTAVPKEFANA
jgi:hypothetical protein